MGSPQELERKIINIFMVASLLFFAMLMIITRERNKHILRAWPLSITAAVLFVINIGVIWYLHLDMDFSEELENRTKVYDQNSLTNYLDRKDVEQMELGRSKFQKIPTGIFIEELELGESYSVNIRGSIWQKWSIGKELKDEAGFHFLQAAPVGRSVITSLASKVKLDSSTWLYTWNFTANLRIFFDYSQYPLDQHYIDIRLSYPDKTEKVILVPDFSSYEILNPSQKPGINSIIFLPNHRIIASYFSFSSLDMKTFFGQDQKSESTELQALEFNIVTKRRFLTPFVSLVIPFVIGSAIIFFLIYSLSRKKEDKSGVTVMGVVQGMAGLFFGMLLAHIAVRNRVQTSQITYLEMFYFAIYVMIILLIINVIMFSKKGDDNIFTRNDNLIAKVSYWPVLMGTLLIITLLKFYF